LIENDQVKIIVENKINRNYKLLPSQTNIYPSDLAKSDKKKFLIYLIPGDYKYKDKIKSISDRYDFISTVYWEKIIDELGKFNANIGSEIITESMSLFNKILEMNQKILFTEEDILFINNTEIFRSEVNTMAKQTELFSNVIEKISESLNFSPKQKKSCYLACEQDAFGYYFYEEYCFLGYSFGLLDNEDKKDFFLSLAVREGVVNKKINDYIIFQPYFDGEWYYFKFSPDIFSNDEGEKILLEQCEKILEEILKK
jgi:hypothetical protein